MSHPQTRRWSNERRHVEPSKEGSTLAAWVLIGIGLLILAGALGLLGPEMRLVLTDAVAEVFP